MPGHLERHTPTQGGIARPTVSDPGTATRMSQLVFETKALVYDQDIPRTFRQGARASTELALRSEERARPGGELIPPRDQATTDSITQAAIASGVRQLSKPRKSSGRIVQRRIGWQATPGLIVITTAERELSPNATGKYSPAGDWLIEDRRTYREASGKATKRTGDVPTDKDTTATRTAKNSAPGHGTEAAVATAFPEGAMALGMLPAQVRSSAIGRVPSPTQFDGVVLQEPDVAGNPVRLEVNVLRMDTSRAVVIHASRKMGDLQWSVSQAAYRLTDPEIEQA